MFLARLVILYFSSVHSVCSYTKYLTDRILWIEYDEYWAKTRINTIESCDKPHELLDYYIAVGYEVKHHTMAATETSYSQQKLAYSWILVKK